MLVIAAEWEFVAACEADIVQGLVNVTVEPLIVPAPLGFNEYVISLVFPLEVGAMILADRDCPSALTLWLSRLNPLRTVVVTPSWMIVKVAG